MQAFIVLAGAAALILLASPASTAADEFEQVCEASDYDLLGIDAPSLPQQFSLHVEANIVNKNRTTWVHELYDDVNNRAKFTFLMNGTREHVIADYTNNEVSIYGDTGRGGSVCTIFPLATSRFRVVTFGSSQVNGSIHIGSARNFLEFLNDSTPLRMMGLDAVRGIPTIRWQACFNMDNLSMTADYYYTTDDWTYATISNPTISDMVLTQIVIQGNSLFRGELNSFYHVYSIIGFHTGPDSVPDSAFAVPFGLTCLGRNPGIPLPLVPDFFTTYIQYVDQMDPDKKVDTIREYYDFRHSLFRLDVYYDGSFGGDPGPLQVIHDFDTQVEYFINRHTGNCSTIPLGTLPFGDNDVTLDEAGSPQLVSPSQLLYRGNNFNYSYEGVTTIRGVEVDAWIATRPIESFNGANLTNAVYEVFLTRPEYTVSTDRSPGVAVVPWRVNVQGVLSYRNFTTNGTESRNISYVMDFFDFSADEPPYDSFDVSICFSGDETHTVVLVFNTSRVGVDFRIFRTNLRAAVVSATNVKPLQVNNINIVTDNTTHIFVAFHLTNLTDIAQVDDPDSVLTANEAAEALTAGAEPGQPLPFQVDIGNGVLASPFLFARGPGRNTTCNIPPIIVNKTCPTSAPTTTMKPSCEDNITNRLNLTDGIVAGIAVGLFFAGFIVALLVLLSCYVCIRCLSGKGVSQPAAVKYQKHADELDAFS